MKARPGHEYPRLEDAARTAMEAARAAAPDLGIAIVFVADIGDEGGIGYVSNINRGDMILALRNLLARWERS